MVERTAPALGLGEVQLTLFQRMRAIFLRYEPLRGYSLLSPTLGVMLLALALPVGMLGAYSFWTQDYLDIDHIAGRLQPTDDFKPGSAIGLAGSYGGRRGYALFRELRLRKLTERPEALQADGGAPNDSP